MFSIEGSAPSVASPLTPDLLKHFAFEAESDEDFELAEHYYKEVSIDTDAKYFLFPPYFTRTENQSTPSGE